MRDVMLSPRAKAAVRLALDEDLASVDRLVSSSWCDATSLALVDPDAVATGEIHAKGAGCVVAGATVAKAVMKAVDPKVKVTILKPDGSAVKPGEPILTFRGKARSILAAERTALNFMQRMCATATLTRRFVEATKRWGTLILDTRKTTPGLRILEKQAVKIGGGMNHRIGLFDMILLKDNHIDFAGGIVQAIDRCHAYLREKGLDLKIEIEVRNFDELQQVLDHGGVNRIMLDNFTPANTHKAVELIDHRYEVESSGGITFDTIRDYAEQGVDFISVGALTHSVKGLDMSFKAIS